MDNLGHLHRQRAAAPVPARGPYRGGDPSGTVHVEIDDAVRRAEVSLAAGWRERVGVHRLGGAVVHAFAEAVTARLACWAAAPSGRPPAGDRPRAAAGRVTAGGDPAQVTSRAWREVREFQVRLAELHDTAVTVTDRDGRVHATVRAGRLVAVEPDQGWAESAADTDVAAHTAQALRAAVRALAALPERALDRCPGLRARLGVPPR